MALYDPVNGVYRKVSKKYDPLDGVYRKIKAAYDPVDGVYRQYFSGDMNAGGLAVGDGVWMNVNGGLTEFLVVHQGNPDSAMYDASCDGTWLLMKDIYELRAWGSSDNDYQNSDIHSYINSTFVGLLDSTVKSAIKQAKIPYWNGVGSYGSVASGASGLSTKIFLLSGYEVGFSNTKLTAGGTCLDYFQGTAATDTRRIAYNNGTAKGWWLRSPYAVDNVNVSVVTAGGGWLMSGFRTTGGLRPAFIFDSNTPIVRTNGINIIA